MLYLRELAKQNQQVQTLTLDTRLPAFIQGPCELDVRYLVEAREDFYIINLEVTGNLIIICQRCMEEFTFPYNNATKIAICATEEQANQLLEDYESIVASNFKVDLQDLVVDELFLYAPQFHPNPDDCNHGIKQILQENNETL